MSKDLEILNNNDVISVVDMSKADFFSGNTLKIQQLLEEYKEYVRESKAIRSNGSTNICDHGIECEVLRQNSDHKGWRKGKIKFVVQFEPDEIESIASSNSLDDIRKQIDTTN